MQNPIDRWTTWRTETEKRLVTEGIEAARRLWLISVGRFVLGIAALMGAQYLPDPWDTIAWGILGGLVGSGALGSMRAPMAYRNGWIAGRNNMVQSVARTGQFKHALEYDAVHVMGLAHPIIPDSPEGLE